MPQIALDADTADRMLSGQIDQADVPPGYGRVSELLDALASTRSPVDERAPVSPTSPRRTSMLASLPARVRVSSIAVAIACCLAGGTAAYAAGLPQSASDTASGILAKLGVTTGSGGSDSGSRGARISAVARDHALTGAAHGAAVSAAASGDKAGSGGSGSGDTGTGNGKGSMISKLATTTTATGVAKGALISTAASGGRSQAGRHGGAGTSDTASAAGRAHAAGSSDGHSSGGSGTTAH